MEIHLEKLDRVQRLQTLGRGMLQQVRRAGTDLLFPPACAGCGDELEHAPRSMFCEDCLSEACLLSGPVCLRCGAPVPGQVDRAPCYRCQETKLWFDATIALGEYEGRLRDWLLAMKDRRSESLALAVGELLSTLR